MFKENLIGKRFGKLVVESVGEATKYGYKWNCICDCGKKISVLTSNLNSGNTKSCGCFQKQVATEKHLKHGQNRRGKTTKLYRCWSDMKTRTNNSKCSEAKHYMGRGISCCKDWLVFENFYNWAINNGYKDGLTIDRINVNGNYCPENCRWITIKEQQRNKRNTIKYKGKPIKEWCETFDINYTTVMTAVYKALARGQTRNSVYKKYFNKKD